MALNDMQSFYTWFKSHNGRLDTSSVDVIQFPASEGGRGAVALKDILVSLVYKWVVFWLFALETELSS